MVSLFWCSDRWPFHSLILYFLRNIVVPRYSQITKITESILQINNTGDINPNGPYIEGKVLSIFLLIKSWLSLSISTLNVSLCLSQFKFSILVSFTFIPRGSFAKFNSFWELRSLVSKSSSFECHLWNLNPLSQAVLWNQNFFSELPESFLSESPNHQRTHHLWFSLLVLSTCFHTFQNVFLGFPLR